METNEIQAARMIVQGSATVLDNFIQAGGIVSNTVKASERLEATGSSINTRIIELSRTQVTLETKFRKYWFPNKKLFVLWNNKVAHLMQRVNSLNDEPNPKRIRLIHRSILTAQFDSLSEEIDAVIEEGKEMGEAMVRRGIKRFVRVENLIDIKNVGTLNKKLEDIVELLKDESKTGLIKLQGEMGTGKRTILEHLNNNKSIVEQQMFDIVIYVRTSDINKNDDGSRTVAGSQHIIAGRLGLNIEGNKDVNVVADQIRTELHDAKYLLLFDDVKVDIDVYATGIPRNTNGSKIVITTNFKHLSFGDNPIGCVEIGRLEPGEDWKLFYNIAKPARDLIFTASKIVKWCDCHFLLIVIVAENLKLEPYEANWEVCLGSLRMAPTKEDKFYKALENFLGFSYSRLDKNQKRCFLFCALYPKHKHSGSIIPRDCLFDCWAALGFLGDDTVENRNGIGRATLNCLIRRAILNECADKQYVIMARVFRRAAMRLLQEEKEFNCLFGKEALGKLLNHQCTDIHWISLADRKIKNLPTKATCPKLTTLFLQKNPELLNIPDSFVNGMGELTVLDLHDTGIKSMARVSNLEKLKVLYVYGTGIPEFSYNVEIHCNLEVLDMRGSAVTEIPDCIKILKRLRRLIISIPAAEKEKVDLKTSKLSSLKEFIIDVKSGGVNEEGTDLDTESRNQVMETTIKNIDRLYGLSTLQFNFKGDVVKVIHISAKIWKIFVPKQVTLVHFLKEGFMNVKNLQVYIGYRMEHGLHIPWCLKDHTKFVISSDKIVNDHNIKEIFAKVKTFFLIHDNNIKHLDDIIEILPGSIVNSVNHIENCLVHKCSKIETIMQTARFSNVKFLVLSKCSYLKVLFSNNDAVMGIEYLEIRGCSSLEEINMKLTSGNGDVFPKLKTLILHKLPELKKIFSVRLWPSLEKLGVYKCDKLTELPFNINGANNLKTIEVEKTWWENFPIDPQIKQKFTSFIEYIQKDTE